MDCVYALFAWAGLALLFMSMSASRANFQEGNSKRIFKFNFLRLKRTAMVPVPVPKTKRAHTKKKPNGKHGHRFVSWPLTHPSKARGQRLVCNCVASSAPAPLDRVPMPERPPLIRTPPAPAWLAGQVPCGHPADWLTG